MDDRCPLSWSREAITWLGCGDDTAWGQVRDAVYEKDREKFLKHAAILLEDMRQARDNPDSSEGP